MDEYLSDLIKFSQRLDNNKNIPNDMKNKEKQNMNNFNNGKQNSIGSESSGSSPSETPSPDYTKRLLRLYQSIITMN